MLHVVCYMLLFLATCRRRQVAATGDLSPVVESNLSPDIFINIHIESRDSDIVARELGKMEDDDDNIVISLYASIAVIIASKRRKRRRRLARSCWVRPWISRRQRFGGYEVRLS